MNIQTLPASHTPVSGCSEPSQHVRVGQPSVARKAWIKSCAARLGQLRPEHDGALIMSVASAMWPDVGSFDPGIAAELEHEAWL